MSAFRSDDPGLQPRLTPRPADDAAFLKGCWKASPASRALGYRRLAELGAQPLRALRTVGGGAANPTWTAIRKRHVPVPFVAALSEEAAVGAALLALQGAAREGMIA